MKKKVLLSSICTIALCLCLIAGSTFALFTSQSDVNISVTAGDVDVVAGIAIDKLESVKGDENGTITDENGATYSYEEVNPFTNGGTATVTEGLLTLKEITPGDKVTFTVTGTNNSNVSTQIRYIVTCEDGYTLMSGLVLHTPDGEYKSVDTYTSEWEAVGVNTNFVKTFALELPVDRGNLYEKQTTDIRILVEAVQGNAVVDNDGKPDVEYIQQVSTDAVAMNAAMADPNVTHFIFVEDMDYTFDMPVVNKLIDANGNDVNLVFNNTIENVVLTNIVANDDAKPAVQFGSDAKGEIIVKDSVLFDHSSQPYGAIAGGNKDVSIVLENCKLSGARPIYCAGNLNNLTLIDCEISNTSSWAILVNTQVYGDVVIDGCTFTNCVGIFKGTRDLLGDFTFTNNTIVDCVTKNGFYVDANVTGASMTVSGNTMVEANNVIDTDVDVADLLGLTKS